MNGIVEKTGVPKERYSAERINTTRRSWSEINDHNVVGDACIGVVYSESTATLIVNLLNQLSKSA